MHHEQCALSNSQDVQSLNTGASIVVIIHHRAVSIIESEMALYQSSISLGRLPIKPTFTPPSSDIYMLRFHPAGAAHGIKFVNKGVRVCGTLLLLTATR